MVNVLPVACFFAACSDKRIEHYKNVVDRSDSITINYIDVNRKVNFSRSTIGDIKPMFGRDIKTGDQSKFEADTRVDFFERSERIAYITMRIADPKMNANFYSDSARFGIFSTYGIWFGLGELKYQ